MIEMTDDLNEYLDWPGVERVFRLVRWRFVKGKWGREVVLGITSLSETAETLLGRVRRHWAIENGLHHVRDVTLGEDRCRVRRGGAPQVLASLRNVVIKLLAGLKYPSLAGAIRHLNAHVGKAVGLVTAH